MEQHDVLEGIPVETSQDLMQEYQQLKRIKDDLSQDIKDIKKTIGDVEIYWQQPKNIIFAFVVMIVPLFLFFAGFYSCNQLKTQQISKLQNVYKDVLSIFDNQLNNSEL